MSVHARTPFSSLLDASAKAASDKRRTDAVLACHRTVSAHLLEILDNGGNDLPELERKVIGIAEQCGLMLSRVRAELSEPREES